MYPCSIVCKIIINKKIEIKKNECQHCVQYIATIKSGPVGRNPAIAYWIWCYTAVGIDFFFFSTLAIVAMSHRLYMQDSTEICEI